MSSRNKPTQTTNPIHFEDLEPHRFEDLVRELIYDYKDWQSIEATGRSGSDKGFDIRAFEKREIVSQSGNNDDNSEQRYIEGNLWMIQGKREKEIGPKKIKNIISKIDPQSPPYGYILAASTHFSIKSYDVFRSELRKKGVMEFDLWGKEKLEDLLHQPKNDHILFTFFSISLVSRRRTRTTEVRSIINIKNKLHKVVGKGDNLLKPILLRDLKDVNYPYAFQYKNFSEKPRWKEYDASEEHPLGLFCNVHKYFAYIDFEKKEFDYTEEVDLINSRRESEDERTTRSKKQDLVNSVWNFFPRKNKGFCIIDCITKYKDIALIDEEGDILYDLPHLYVDFNSENGPFDGFKYTLKIGDRENYLTEDYKRVNIFPKKFYKLTRGKIYRDKKILLNQESQKEFKEYHLDTLYDDDGKYDYLKSKDIIIVNNPEEVYEFIQITYKFKTKIKDYLLEQRDFRVKNSMKMQLGRDVSENDKGDINVYEFDRYPEWKIKKAPKKMI